MHVAIMKSIAYISAQCAEFIRDTVTYWKPMNLCVKEMWSHGGHWKI